MTHENVRDICVVGNQLKDNYWRTICAKDRTIFLRHGDIQHTELNDDWVWFLSWLNTSNGEIIRYDKRTKPGRTT